MSGYLWRDILIWLGETLSKIPILSGFFQARSTEAVTLHVSGVGLACDMGTGALVPIDVSRVPALLAEIERKTAVVLTIGRDCYLRRNLASKRLPFTRASELWSLEISEHMPFLIGQVHVFFGFARDGQGTDYFIAKKEVLEPVLSAIHSSGRRIDRILMENEGQAEEVARESVRSIADQSSRWSVKNRLSAGFSLFVLLIAIATFGHAYARTAEAGARLAILVDERRREALAVRKEVDALQMEERLLQAARAAKIKTVPASALWEELTRILPDSTWLSDLALREDVVSIAGFSRAAADLIGMLGASAVFRDPRFTAPVTRVPGQDGERFTIHMKVGRQ